MQIQFQFLKMMQTKLLKLQLVLDVELVLQLVKMVLQCYSLELKYHNMLYYHKVK